MNIFLGIPIPTADIHLLTEMLWQEHPHWRDHPAIRWTVGDHHHLTLHFFGVVNPELLTGWITDLESYLNSIHNFYIKINKLYNFPKENSDLLAAYVQLSAPLAKLYQRVQQAVADHQFLVETRPYSPHITLCRAKRRHILTMEPIIVPDYSIAVTRLVLYQTQAIAGGSRYIPLQGFQLRES